MFKTYAGVQAGGQPSPIGSPQGASAGATAGGWHPSVLYMLVLVLAEIFLVGWITTVLR